MTVDVDGTDEKSLLVTVEDNGNGIPLEVQENLFQKFSRGKQIKRGSGLGLYFCKMVTEAHNGRIWLERSDENGTVIQFSLPLTEEIVRSQPDLSLQK